MPRTPSSRILLLALGALVLVCVIAAGIRNQLELKRTAQELNALRARVYAARVAADSCANELAYQERLFRRFDDSMDSLRATVRGFERLDARGVPEDRYDEYMEHFDGYNDSVAAWRAKADSLKATEAACRAFIARHNGLTDSLRVRLEAEGIDTHGADPLDLPEPPDSAGG